ncbi:MAG: hypothetical protein ABR865_09635 [Terracidiphilus sp.]
MLEEMLAEESAKTTVKASLTSDVGPKKITAMNFTITSPAVRIGPIQLAGVSPAMQAKVNTLVNGQTGNEFDTENTAIGLQRSFEDLYQDLGYAAVEVDVVQIDPPIVSGQSSDLAIEIPYSVTIRRFPIRSLSGKAEFTSSAPSTIRQTRWLRARRFRSFWRSIRPAPAGRSISFFWPSTTPIMPGAISIAPSSLTLRSARPRTS